MRYAIGCALALIFSAPCAAAMAPAKDVPKKGRSHAAPKAAQQDTLASIDYSKIVTRELQRELKEHATAPNSAVAAALEVPTAAPRARERRQAGVLTSHRTCQAIAEARQSLVMGMRVSVLVTPVVRCTITKKKYN